MHIYPDRLSPIYIYLLSIIKPEKTEAMEQNVNPWKANLNNGIIMLSVGIVYSLVMYFLDLSLNKVQGYVFMVVQFALLVYLLKSYRDNYMYGIISFGQSFGAGVIINLYYAIGTAIFTYILFKYIDPELVKKSLAMTEEQMVRKGAPQASIDAAMKITAKLMKPEIMAPFTVFGTMIWGVILSLLASIFVKKEGNPLIDNTEIR